MKGEDMKITTSITIEENILNDLKEEAKRDNRTLSNLLINIIKKYLKK
jgi:predicted DNA-binding ribbon-helix-helix protein